ncbi:cytochrome P450 2C18-like [Dendropsophus ebraccatus]|uniref:cytochrome P450 2C18-like n=1 Tax=Dendropsophus ebraccatus TaxID=150705 RepID=UPI003831037E
MMDFGPGWILVLCITFLILIIMWSERSKRKEMPPGPTPLPLLGNILQLNIKAMPQSLMTLAKTYGDVFTIYLGSRRVVVLHGCDAVKEALIDHAEVFSKRGRIPVAEIVFKDFGVIFSNGERWKQLRRFSLTTLRNFGMGKRSLEEHIQEEARFLRDEFNKRKGIPCDPTYFLTLAVSNMICSIVFGERFEYDDRKFLGLLALLKEVFNLLNSGTGQLVNAFPKLFQLIPGPHRKIYQNLNSLKQFVQGKVKEHQETLDQNCPRDFIDCFLIKMEEEKGNPNTEFYFDNLFVTVLNLFFAGTETTSTTLRHSLRLSLKHADVQAKVQKEIDTVVGPDRSPSIEDRSKMPYTEAVIHEIQRYADIVPMGLPHAAAETTKFRGYTIPKDTTVFVFLSSVLKDPKYFRNPSKFDPQHFLNDKGEFKKNDAFLPFSTGRRVCLGEGMARMEIFLFLTFILQNFSLESDEDPSDIDITPLPYKIRFVPR